MRSVAKTNLSPLIGILLISVSFLNLAGCCRRLTYPYRVGHISVLAGSYSCTRLESVATHSALSEFWAGERGGASRRLRRFAALRAAMRRLSSPMKFTPIGRELQLEAQLIWPSLD